MKRFASVCLAAICGYFFSMPPALAQDRKATLRAQISHIIDTAGASIGVGLMGLDFNDSVQVNGNGHYPMQSVFKFPLAMAILHQADKGKFSLKQKIHIPKNSLDTATWSPLLKDFPNQDINIMLSDLLMYSVSKSDNNACDVLFRLAGGTGVVNQYVHSLGVKDIAIAATERGMKKNWGVQYTNWCTPAAMLQLLRIFYNGKVLSKRNNDFLMSIMTASENSPNRIKGLLPEGTTVAHKTGSSDTNESGITAATNDAGIVTLPDGRHYAIVVYMSDYWGGGSKGERVIAEISRLVWDYYTGQ
jgi:beta-lactamase class A